MKCLRSAAGANLPVRAHLVVRKTAYRTRQATLGQEFRFRLNLCVSCHEILQSQETTRSGAGGTRAAARKSAADTTGHITHRTTGTLEQVSHNPPPSKHENRTGKYQEPEEREAVLLLARFIDRIFFAHGFPAFAARSRVGSWMAPDLTNLR